MSQKGTSRRSLGTWRATSLVVGNMIGSGIFLLPASIGGFGTLGVVGWALTAVGAMLLALVFARLSRHLPKMGGPYAYSRLAFGDFIGFQMAWSYWIANWVSNAAVAVAFVSYMSVFWPSLNTSPDQALLLSVGTLWVLTFVNMVGIRSAGTLQVVATALKIIPLIAIAVFGGFFINFDNYLPLNPSSLPPMMVISSAAAITLFSFMGLESATIPADSVEEPDKTIPLATIFGTGFTAVVYIWVMVVLLGLLPAHHLASSPAPFAEAGRVIFGSWAEVLIAGSAAISCFGTLNGWILIQGQMPLAAAQDGLFPKVFLKTSKNGVPVLGLVLTSVLITILLTMNYQANLVEQFTLIITFTTFAILLPYLYSSVADLYFLFTDKRQMPRGRLIRSASVALLAFLYSVWAIFGAGQEIVFMGVIFIFSSFPIYVWMKKGSGGGVTYQE